MNDELLYKIAITMLSDVGDVTAKKLIAYCGGIEAVFSESVNNLRKIPNINEKIINSIKSSTVFIEVEKEIKFIEANNIRPLFYLDKEYPQRLKACNDGPILLYYKGNADLNAKRVLSIVGTRNPSDYGQEVCNEFINDLSTTNALIVSGLAYGVDACSHKSSLKHNLNTVGVLGHGLDRIYPNQNLQLSEKMQNNGGLLTEFRRGVKPDRQNFPMRNRIVAGMSDATLVIESKSRGGSLITAYLAFNYNRDVFAIPGRPKDNLSTGCNNIIKYNVAQLVLSAKDITKALNWEEETKPGVTQKQLFVELEENEQRIADIMSFDKEMAIDIISLKSGLPISKTAVILLNMEFKGVVKALPGKQYKKI